MNNKINPVVLCGGVGTRLWPLSRSENPKQFQPISIDSEVTFFQSTIGRHSGDLYNEPTICVSARHVGTAISDLGRMNMGASIIAEPMAKNTGPAVLASALSLFDKDSDAIMMVLPSDHIISGNFDEDIQDAMSAACAGYIVIFGIHPEYPETGYGYIVDGGKLGQGLSGSKVARFVEKPKKELAESLIATDSAYWASGISLFRADVLIEEYKKTELDTYLAVLNAYEKSKRSANILYLNAESFSKANSASTESEIFENSELVALAKTKISWSDVGAWDAFYAIGEKNEDGNVINGDVLTYDTKNSYIRPSERLVAVLGVEDLIIVDTEDALLVTKKGETQKIKTVVEDLVQKKRPESSRHVKQKLQWGHSDILQQGDGFSVAAMVLDARRSMFIEAKIDENKIIMVVEGQCDVSINNKATHLSAGDTQNVKFSNGALIENLSDSELQIIVVTCALNDADTLDIDAKNKASNILDAKNIVVRSPKRKADA